MAFLNYNDISIIGLSSCVPKDRFVNINSGKDLFEKEQLDKTINTIGVIERRIASNDVCASDLCYKAAVGLFNEMQIDKESINVIIFISQTPDFRIPSTACVLQNRLGLSKNTAAFDINLGCSGYIYGLTTAFSYAQNPGINRVLLLVGDTVTKFTSSRDKSLALLFGDAGSATLIEKKNNNTQCYFSLCTDGGGADFLKINAGGFRNPSSLSSLKDKTFEDGTIRNEEQLMMNGAEIFNFAIREVPKDIKNLLKLANENIENIDYFVFHQANKFMLDYISKKLKLPFEKVPLSLLKYGNTSSVSIPLTIITELKENLNNHKAKVILSGFGVGLSWGTAIIELDNCCIPDLIEY